MMGVMAMVFWLLAAATAQALAPSWHHMGEPSFPILSGVVLYAATHKGSLGFTWVALAAGVLEDSLSQAPLGCSAVAYLAAGGLALALREDFNPDKATVAMPLGAGCTALSTGVMAVLLKGRGLTAFSWGTVLERMVGSALLGAVLTPLLFGLMRSMERRLGCLEERL